VRDFGREGKFSNRSGYEFPLETKEIHFMGIGNAVQRGAFIYIYDEKGRQSAIISAGSGTHDGLTGYTSSTVNCRRGPFIYSYDEKGRQLTVTPAG
jgi:hypothetical protein